MTYLHFWLGNYINQNYLNWVDYFISEFSAVITRLQKVLNFIFYKTYKGDVCKEHKHNRVCSKLFWICIFTAEPYFCNQYLLLVTACWFPSHFLIYCSICTLSLFITTCNWYLHITVTSFIDDPLKRRERNIFSLPKLKLLRHNYLSFDAFFTH